MKYLLLLLGVLFVLPLSAFATSGACSYHGGVDCSLRAGSYAVCNDGSISSVRYDDMVMCQVYDGCRDERDYDALEAQKASARATLIAGGGYRSHSGTTLIESFDTKLRECRKEINAYKNDIETYNNDLEDAKQAELKESCEDQHTDAGTWNYSVINKKCSLTCRSGYTKEDTSCVKSLVRKPELPVEEPVAEPAKPSLFDMFTAPKPDPVKEEVSEPETAEVEEMPTITVEKPILPTPEPAKIWWEWILPWNWF